MTPAPVRESLGPSLDRWTGITLGTAPPLLLVHGYAPQGKDDPRLARAARLLARAGFDVVVPTLPGLTRGRPQPVQSSYMRVKPRVQPSVDAE